MISLHCLHSLPERHVAVLPSEQSGWEGRVETRIHWAWKQGHRRDRDNKSRICQVWLDPHHVTSVSRGRRHGVHTGDLIQPRVNNDARAAVCPMALRSEWSTFPVPVASAPTVGPSAEITVRQVGQLRHTPYPLLLGLAMGQSISKVPAICGTIDHRCLVLVPELQWRFRLHDDVRTGKPGNPRKFSSQ